MDIGPGAGEHGGKVVAIGTAEDIMKCEESITGAYLSGRMQIPVPSERRKPSGWITVKGAAENNLKNIDVNFPLGVMTCVTGVSGSGKSSLVNEILYKSLARKLNRARTIPGRAQVHRGRGTAGQDHRHRPVPHRAHPRSNRPPTRACST